MKKLKTNQPEFKVQSGAFAGTVYKRDVEYQDSDIPTEYANRFVAVKTQPVKPKEEKSK